MALLSVKSIIHGKEVITEAKLRNGGFMTSIMTRNPILQILLTGFGGKLMGGDGNKSNYSGRKKLVRKMAKIFKNFLNLTGSKNLSMIFGSGYLMHPLPLLT